MSGMSTVARDWRDLAACRTANPDDFFPVSRPHSEEYDREAARALAVCRSCPVTVHCLRFAVGTRAPEGIWGGTTAGQRDQGRQNLARGAA